MKNLKLFIEGIIIGIGKIIPGVSGAMFAMMFGVYEKAVGIISDLRKLKGNISFMFFLCLGILIAIILGSTGIKLLLEHYYLWTMIFFIGMMCAGIPPLFKHLQNRKIEPKNIVVSLFVVSLLVILSLVDFHTNDAVIEKTPFTVITLFLCGILDAMGTVIPGVCGTALLMIAGYYNKVIGALSNIVLFKDLGTSIFILLPFTVGLLVGIVMVSKLVNYLFKHHKTTTYCSIIGFAVVSAVILFLRAFSINYTLYEVIIAILLYILGYYIVTFLETKLSYKKKK